MAKRITAFLFLACFALALGQGSDCNLRQSERRARESKLPQEDIASFWGDGYSLIYLDRFTGHVYTEYTTCNITVPDLPVPGLGYQSAMAFNPKIGELLACVSDNLDESPTCFLWNGNLAGSWTSIPKYPGTIDYPYLTNTEIIRDGKNGAAWWLQRAEDSYLYQDGVWQKGLPGPLDGDFPEGGCLVQFQDRNFLWTGGMDNSGAILDKAWVYSRSNKTWTETNKMQHKFYGHSCTLVDDNGVKVMVAGSPRAEDGGMDGNIVSEIYNPETMEWTAGPGADRKDFVELFTLDEKTIMVQAMTRVAYEFKETGWVAIGRFPDFDIQCEDAVVVPSDFLC